MQTVHSAGNNGSLSDGFRFHGRQLMHFVVRSRLHIQACSLAAAWAWSHMLQSNLHLMDLLPVPLAVGSVYRWNRLTDICEDAVNCPREVPAVSEYRVLQLLCVVSGCLSITIAAISREPKSAILVSLVLALGLFYNGTRRQPSFRLKDVFFLKNLSSAMGWSALTVLYPSVFAPHGNAGRLAAAFGCMLVSVFIVEVIWDVRDVEGDRASGIRTIPVIMGLGSAKRVTFLANAVFSLVVLSSFLSGQLSLIWTWGLINAALIFLSASSMLDALHSNRLWSHMLVVAQTLMLVAIAVLTRNV